MPKRRWGGLFNVLAALFLGLAVISTGWTVEIALNPYGRLNPLRPSAPVVVVVPSTATPTLIPDTPTLSPMDTPTPALTETPVEATRQPSPTPSLTTTVRAVSLTFTPVPSPTRSAVTYTAVITYQVHPMQVCDWMGVAGTVTDLQGKQSLGAWVHVWGLGNVDEIVAAGANPIYGPSGWELRLARAQIVGDWKVQLIASANNRIPLSDAYTISMPGDCKRNLALVNFQQNH